MNFRIRKKMIGYYVLLFIFISPQCIQDMENLGTFKNMLALFRYIISIYVFLKSFLEIKSVKKNVNAYDVTFCIAFLLQIVALHFNGTLYLTAGLSCFTYIGFFILNKKLYRKDKIQLLMAYKRYLLFCLLCHIGSIFIFKNGLVKNLTGDNRVYFMGRKNAFVVYMVLFYLVSLILLQYENAYNKKKKIAGLTIFCTVVLIINPSAVGLGTILMVDGYAVISQLDVKEKNVKRYLQQMFIAFVLIMILSFFYFTVFLNAGNNGVMNSLVSIFGKDITFSGRRAIWVAAIANIAQAPFWGKGLDVIYDVWSNSKYVYSAHNLWLDYGVKYGCISLGVIIANMFIFYVKLLRKKRDDLVRFCIVISSSILFASMFEAFESYYVFWVIMEISFMIQSEKI